MLSGYRRAALLTGVLLSTLAMPALAADVDTLKEEATQSDQPLVMATSAVTQSNAGPVVSRESLDDQVNVVGGVEQTRSAAGLASVKRLRAARAAKAAGHAGNGNGYYRSSAPIILGVRF
ncbi:MAG: hypothetical protein AB7O44_01345 [Hyphomicrobiaceae bacterium]